jgi:hypothetical protein
MKSLVFIGSILFSLLVFFTPPEVFSQDAPEPVPAPQTAVPTTAPQTTAPAPSSGVPSSNTPSNARNSDGTSLRESGFIPPSNLPTFDLENENNPVAAFERILLNYIISPIFLISGGVAVIVILYSSFRLVTSRAQEDSITAAKTTLIWAFVGLALVMLAYTIVSNLASIILEQL